MLERGSTECAGLGLKNRSNDGGRLHLEEKSSDPDHPSSSGTEMEARWQCEQHTSMPADSDDVIYLDGFKKVRRWTDQGARREQDKYISNVKCRVKSLRNGGIMICEFGTESDLAFVESFDWSTPIDG